MYLLISFHYTHLKPKSSKALLAALPIAHNKNNCENVHIIWLSDLHHACYNDLSLIISVFSDPDPYGMDHLRPCQWPAFLVIIPLAPGTRDASLLSPPPHRSPVHCTGPVAPAIVRHSLLIAALLLHFLMPGVQHKRRGRIESPQRRTKTL